MEKWNLNDLVKVKLTAYGVKVHFNYYNAINEAHDRTIIPPAQCMPNIDGNGYTTYQLWDFINIFGSSIHMGMQNVIDPIEIIRISD